MYLCPQAAVSADLSVTFGIVCCGQHLAPASRRPHLRLRRSVRARPRPRPPSHWASSSDSSFNATAFLVVVPLLAGLAVVGVYIAHHLKLQAVWAVEGVNEVLLS